ncbi:PAS domain S-box protein [Telluribacter sp. SYSU D00476]|uniref:PAS domain-containing sensor histidine kinase n=1 Tax=Telluribacter sp. SYSU D00476 TaxID=2811430 RepID=UPI001FF31E42|nr:PAS domain S-box protein [Telluribacter sp. SYSU D00476]
MTGDYQPYNPSRNLNERLDIDFALQAAGLGVWELDPATSQVLWDDRCRELFGLAKDNLLTYEKAIQYIHPQDRERVDQAVQRAMNPQTDGWYDVTYRTLGADDGKLRWVRFYGRSYFTEAGQVYRFAGVAQEVTQQVLARQQQQQLAVLAEQAPEFMAVTDLEGRMQYVNQYGLELFGLTQEQVLNRHLTEFVPPEEMDRVNAEIMPSVLAGEWAGFVTLMQPLTQQRIPVACNAYLLLDPDSGQPYGMAGIVRDRRPELKAQQKQQEIEARFQSLATQAPLGVFIADEQAYVEYWNPWWLNFTGQTLEQALGRSWEQLIHPHDLDALLTGYLEASRQQVSYSIEARVRRRDGTYRYLLFTGGPRYTADGTYVGNIGTGLDIDDRKQAEHALAESEARFRTMAEEADILIAMSNEIGQTTYMNQAWTNLTGRSVADLMDRGWVDLVHPEDREAFLNLYQNAIQQQVSFSGEFRILNKLGEYRWLLAQCPTRFRPDGTFTGYISSCVNITDIKLAEDALRLSEAKLRSVVETAPVAIGLFMGRDLVIELPNQTFIDIVGKGPDIVGKPLREVMPELDTENQPFLQILDDVYTSGKQFSSAGALVQIVRQGVMTYNYYNITYTPLFNEAGEVYAILDIAVDVTEQIHAQQELEQQKTYLQNALDIADLGTYHIDVATNLGSYRDNIRQWFGLESPTESMEVILSKVHPDDRALVARTLDSSQQSEGTGRHDITYRLADTTGKTTRYLRSIGKTLFNEGQPYAINGIIQDVTPQIQARQILEERETALRGAIELAELGTWELDVATGRVTYSDRIKSWFGFDGAIESLQTVYNPIHEKDRSRVEAALLRALEPGSSGLYDEEYTLVNRLTGQERIVHAQGITLFDEQRRPIKITGTAQDITPQRRLQLALEQQVQQRTKELEAANAKLAATNAEYAALNKELEEANVHLVRSNENLQQFAYVASHDLQEPLRKIQQFGDLLQNRYGEALGDGAGYIKRMQSSARRMSALIEDLLDYSRISTRREASSTVALNAVVKRVLSTLDWAVQEAEAQVSVEPLPTILGDASQLNQLFQNLLSNALKFRRLDGADSPSTGSRVVPQIKVRSEQVLASDLPERVKPARAAGSYYRIDVIDNGVGFDEKYLDRIFQVFQRLHGKSQYAGTGIGLAICEKVAANHGGAITANSRPGQGSVFSVYFPDSNFNAETEER